MEQVKEQFKKVIEYSQRISDPQVDELFERWLDAKQWFINAFGGKLIYEHPEKISFHLSESHKDKRILEFEEHISSIYQNDKLVDFIELNKASFFKNVVENAGNYHKDIKKGMKLVKAFKFFEDNKDVLYRLQSEASRIIQEGKIEGTLCFSVHPLDFLSVSCNNYNWRSCHALDGEYRAGNLSYMVDKATMVVYLKGADNVNIPLFPDDVPWNSKKWRVLWYVANEMEYMFAGKQYPFESWEGMETAKNVFLSLFPVWAKSSAWCNWTDPVINYVTDSHERFREIAGGYHIVMRGKILPLSQVVKDGEKALQFNDVLRSSCYKPHYTAPYNYSYYPAYESTLTIGQAVKCLHCGLEEITNPETMRCDECEEKYGYEANHSYVYCECCGSRFHIDDICWVDDEAICGNCYHKEFFECESCGEIIHNSSKRYDSATNEYICEYCYNERYCEEEE